MAAADDVLVVGGGIVGTATALALAEQGALAHGTPFDGSP